MKKKALFMVMAVLTVSLFAACSSGKKSEGEPTKAAGEKKNEGLGDTLSSILGGEGDASGLLDGGLGGLLGREDEGSGKGNLGGDEGSSGGLDIGGILSGETDINDLISGDMNIGDIIDQMDPATKAKFFEEAKKDGMEITENPDGSITYKQDDGSVMTQDEDGTIHFEDADGSGGTLGGGWPDNEYTKMLPKPSFSVVYAGVSDGTFGAALSTDSMTSVKAYIEKVEEKGFTLNKDEYDETVGGIELYSFSAKNADGYRVDATYSYGMFSISLTKE